MISFNSPAATTSFNWSWPKARKRAAVFIQVFEVASLDIVTFILGKTKFKNRAPLYAEGDEGPITAGSSFTRTGEPLLDETAAQIRVRRAQNWLSASFSFRSNF